MLENIWIFTGQATEKQAINSKVDTNYVPVIIAVKLSCFSRYVLRDPLSRIMRTINLSITRCEDECAAMQFG